MADIRISQLPTAPNPIDGTELVPVVQNGLTVQTTVAAITQSPSLTETFLTVGQQPLLPNSRYFSAGVGLGLADGGSLGPYTISLNGTSGSLETASTGVIVKSAPNTISARTLSTSGNGVSVTNGDGVSGNPTFQLTGLAAALANMSGAGLVGLNSTTLTPLTLIGVNNEISITDGNGAGGNPTIGIADNAVFPGVEGVTVPNGTTAERGTTQGQIRYNTTSNRFEGKYSTGWQTFGTGDGAITSVAGTTNQIVVSTVGGAATVSIDPDPVIPGVGAIQIPAGTTVQRPGGVDGQLRYNTNTATFEGYANGSWGAIVTGTGVTSISTGTGLTGGPITSTGTISIANTGAVAGTYGNAARTVTQAVNAQGQITSIFDQPIDGIALTTGSISTAPTTSNDLVNKSYVDGLVATGLTYHQPVQAATTGTLASITGGTVTYNNGTAGVGATLTLSVALTTLDGYTLLNTNRILVKDEANQAHNGVYTWATGGTVLTRATDADTYGTSPNQLSQNDYFFVQNGTVNKGTSYVVTTVGTITFGTTAITFAEFSTSQVYTAGTGLTLTGTQFSLTAPVTAALGGTGQSSYTTGDLLFASGSTALSKLPLGTTNYVLTAGATAPQYAAQSTLSVGTATNIAGGASGSIPYQTAAGATSLLSVGTNGYILTVSGGLPSWQPAPATGVTSFQTSLSGLTPSTSTTGAVTLAGTLGVDSGGTGLTSVTANRIPYGNGTSALQTSANLTFDGTTLTNTGNAIISDNSSNAALRITQVGAGNALLVEDSANPDATPTVIDASGKVVIGYTTDMGAGSLQIKDASASMYTYAANAFTNTFINFYKSRNTTPGSFTVLQSGDELGYLFFRGDNGSAFNTAASIGAVVDGTPGTNDMPGRLVFSTTADGASSPTERMRIDNRGAVGIGSTALTTVALRLGTTITGGTTAYGAYWGSTVQPSVTSSAIYNQTFAATAANGAVPYTVGALRHYSAGQSTFNADSTVTTQIGFAVESTVTGATNNYGFWGNIASGTGRYNLYMGGTADNYLAGSLGIGATPVAGQNLLIGKTFTGAVSTFGTINNGTVQSDVTNTAQYFRTTASTAAATFTLSDIRHYNAVQGTFGLGSTVTNQYGFIVDATLTGATNNYGFYSNIASGSNRFNFYANGTATNYFAGNVGVGTATPAVKFAVSSTDAILVPVGTTAQRPTGATGYIRYNSDTGGFEGYSGSSWGSLGGGNTTTYGLWENNATISANYTITAGNNAMSAGPITVASGVVVTVPSGSTWTIV